MKLNDIILARVEEELNEEESNALKVLASIPISSTQYMSDEDKLAGVEQMLRDLQQLSQQDGCIAAGWAVDVLRVMAARSLNPHEIPEEEISAEMMNYNDIMDQIDEEIEEGWNPWSEPSQLLFSYRMILSFLRSAKNEVSFRYGRHKDLSEFAQHLCAGAIISGWKVMVNDGENICLAEEEGE